MDSIEIGSRVEITGKNIQGNVAFLGTTQFNPGKWVGLILDKPKGKNNGTVKDVKYFTCENNHGMFVRMSQLSLIGEDGVAVTIENKVNNLKSAGLRRPSAGRPSLAPGEGKQSSEVSSILQSGVIPSDPIRQSEVIEQFQFTLKDLREKINTIKVKKNEDEVKLKEMNKKVVQLEQLKNFKEKTQSQYSELKKQLQQIINDKDALQTTFDRYKDEKADIADQLEELTLDKLTAEEQAESCITEMANLKDKLEEITLDYQILEEEISCNEDDNKAIANNMKLKQLVNQLDQLQDALSKMKAAGQTEKLENRKLQKFHSTNKAKKLQCSKENQVYVNKLEKLNIQLEELEMTNQDNVAAPEMCTKLTNKLQLLSEKISKLEEDKEQQEDINNIDEEILEMAHEREIELQEELDTALLRVEQLTTASDTTKQTILHLEKAISAFRQQMASLKEDKVESRVASTSSSTPTPQTSTPTTTTTTATTTTDDVEENALISSPDSSNSPAWKTICAEKAARIRGQLLQANTDYSNCYLEGLRLFLPDDFSAKHGVYDCINLTTIFPRLLSKLTLVATNLQNKINAYDSLAPLEDGTTVDAEKNDLLRFHNSALLFLFHLTHLSISVERYKSALCVCSIEQYRSSVTILDDLSAIEREIDNFLVTTVTAINSSTTPEPISIDNVVKMNEYFKKTYTQMFSSLECCDTKQFLLNIMQLARMAFNCINQYVSSLKAFAGHSSSSSGILSSLAAIEDSMSKAKNSIGEVKRYLIHSKENLSFNKTCLMSDLENFLMTLTHIVNALNSTTSTALEMYKDNGSIPNEKLEIVFSNNIEENFNKSDVKFDKRLENVHCIWTSISEDIYNGVYMEQRKQVKNHQVDTIDKIAEQIRAEFACSEAVQEQTQSVNQDSVMLKDILNTQATTLEEKRRQLQQEEGDLGASLQKVEKMSDNLKCLQDDLSLTNQQLRDQQDTSESLMKNNEKLSNEIKRMKEKIEIVKLANPGLVNKKTLAETAIDSEITRLRHSLRHITADNSRLHGLRNSAVDGFSSSTSSCRGAGAEGEGGEAAGAVGGGTGEGERGCAAVYHFRKLSPISVYAGSQETPRELQQLAQETKAAIADCKVDLASMQVVDLWSKVPPRIQMQRQQRKTKELAKKAQDLQTRLICKMSEVYDKNHVKTSFATFPSYQFIQSFKRKR